MEEDKVEGVTPAEDTAPTQVGEESVEVPKEE